MGKWLKMRKIIAICLTLVLVSLVYQTVSAKDIQIPVSLSKKDFVKTNGEIPFIPPNEGGWMAHYDQKMSDCINMPIPEKDVGIAWHKCDVPGEYGGSKGLGFVSNGEIAAASYSGLSNNLIIYEYDGNILWKSGTHLNALACASAPMIDSYGRVIACDNKAIIMVDLYDVDSDGKILEWKSDLVDGGLPISPTITENQVIIVATTNDPVYAFDFQDGSLLAKKYLNDNPDGSASGGYYETINTPAVNCNRVHISTQFSNDNNPANRRARLYALDVDIDSSNFNDRIEIVWHYDFDGPSGASPLLIGNTIYFDGNKSLKKNPFTMAVIDKGGCPELKWKVSIPKPIDSSLARDPRGGFWLVDALGGQLIHQAESDGRFIKAINTDKMISEYGIHMPCSVITICGSKNKPILLTSALSMDLLKSSCYVIAVDLSNNNNLLWKVKIFEGALTSVDFPFGQYPIIIKDNEPRIIFTSIGHGAWAIGSGEEDDESLISKDISYIKPQTRFLKISGFLNKILGKIKTLLQSRVLNL